MYVHTTIITALDCDEATQTHSDCKYVSMYVRKACSILRYTFNIELHLYIHMYVRTYKSYCMYDVRTYVCMYNACNHPSPFLPALNVCLPFMYVCMYLLTCTPLPSLPTTPAQASVDEKSGEVRRLQDTVRQLQEEQRNKDSVSPSSSAVALSSGQQRKTLLSLRRPRTSVTELVSTYVHTYMLYCLACWD